MKLGFFILSIIILSCSQAALAVNCKISAERRVKSINPWANKITVVPIGQLNPKKGKIGSGTQAYKIDMHWRDNGKYIPRGNYKGTYILTFSETIIKNKCILTQLNYLGFNKVQ